MRLGKSDVWAVRYSPEGARLATGIRDKTMRLWDTVMGELRGALTGHTEKIRSRGPRRDMPVRWMREISSVVFSPDGSVIASLDYDDTLHVEIVRLWDAMKGEPKRTLIGHTDWIYGLAFSPDGTTLASGSWDGTMLVWKVAD